MKTRDSHRDLTRPQPGVSARESSPRPTTTFPLGDYTTPQAQHVAPPTLGPAQVESETSSSGYSEHGYDANREPANCCPYPDEPLFVDEY